jgi:hypothetical protein
MLQWRAAVAALSAAGALLLAPAAWAQNAIQSITSSQQAGTEVVRIELVRGAGGRAQRLFGAGAAAHRHRPARRDQCAGPQHGRDQPGQPAFGGRGHGRRAHAPGAEPQAGLGLPRPGAGQGAAADAGRVRPGRLAAAPTSRCSSRRRRTSLRKRCATSTSAAGPMAPAASSSACPARRWASTSASRGRRWSSSSCAPPCPTPAPPARRHRLRHPGEDRGHLPER